MRYIFLSFVLLFTFGCSSKNATTSNAYDVLTRDSLVEYELESYTKDFLNSYYFTWNLEDLRNSQDDALWAHKTYTKYGNYIQENLQPANPNWFDDMLDFSNFDSYATLLQPALVNQNTNLRVFPTIKPLYKITYQGSGYPFDILQNSYVSIMSPALISHFSKDGSWAFVETSSASGWIEANHLTQISKHDAKKIQALQHIVVIKENAPIYSDDKSKKFISNLKIGTILPTTNEDENFYHIYLIDRNGKSYSAIVDKTAVSTLPLELTDANAMMIIKQLLGEKYGWGGSYGNRDCSAMTKDFMSVFGIWLPRNSASQKNIGEFFDLSRFSNKEKNEIIKNFGAPYQTLVYLPGHIMLYVGNDDTNALLLHNIWGLRTLQDDTEGRYIIGKTIVSDLFIGEGKKSIDQKKLLISRVTGFSIIGSKKDILATKLRLSYPDYISHIEDNFLYFKDNTSLILNDKRAKTFDGLLNSADIEDMFRLKYPKGALANPPKTDPGRFRSDEFFKKIYGNNQESIEKNLVDVIWLPNKIGKKIKFNKNNGAAKALQDVSNELDKLPDSFLPYLTDIAGTYNYRYIANTYRLSMHSFGIAIDLNVKYSHYWRWDKEDFKYQNQIPQEIVDIFEKHGFVWGGKWYHYDTMHFEYRPELL